RELASTVSIKANTTAEVFMCNMFMSRLRDNNGVPRFEQNVACTVFAFNQFFVVHRIFLLRSALVSEDINSLGISELRESRARQGLQHCHVGSQRHGPTVRYLASYVHPLTIHLRDRDRHSRVGNILLQLLGNRD